MVERGGGEKEGQCGGETGKVTASTLVSKEQGICVPNTQNRHSVKVFNF